MRICHTYIQNSGRSFYLPFQKHTSSYRIILLIWVVRHYLSPVCSICRIDYNTWYSPTVSKLATDHVQLCLTMVMEWETLYNRDTTVILTELKSRRKVAWNIFFFFVLRIQRKSLYNELNLHWLFKYDPTVESYCIGIIYTRITFSAEC